MGCGVSSQSSRYPETVDLSIDTPRKRSNSIVKAAPSVSVDLSDSSLTSVPDLSLHIDVKALNLSRNKLSELSLPGISNTLSDLSVADCALRTVDPEAFLSIPRLVSLNLSGNDLSSLPATLARCPHLTHLDLSRNRFTTIPPSVLELPSLQFLSLDSNLLTDLPKGLFKLTKLSELRLSNNQIVTLTEDFGSLTSLSRCDVSSNKIISLPKSVSKLRSLVFFDTHGNPMSLSSTNTSVGIVKPTSTSTGGDGGRLVNMMFISFTPPAVSGPVLVSNLQQLLDESLFSDCRLIVEDTVTFRAHKCILAARCSSRFWNEILFELNIGSEVRLYNIPAAVVTCLLQFLYTETLPPHSTNAVLTELRDLALRFGMPRLVTACDKILSGHGIPVNGTLVRDLHTMWRGRMHTDAKFISETGNASCHRCMLACRSPVLKDVFAKQKGIQMGEVVVEYPLEVVNGFLEYVYTDMVTIGASIAEPLMALAAEFKMPRLLELCEVTLCGSVDMTNVVHLYLTALRHSADQLLQRTFLALCNAYPTLGQKSVDPHHKDEVLAFLRLQPDSSVLISQIPREDLDDTENMSPMPRKPAAGNRSTIPAGRRPGSQLVMSHIRQLKPPHRSPSPVKRTTTTPHILSPASHNHRATVVSPDRQAVSLSPKRSERPVASKLEFSAIRMSVSSERFFFGGSDAKPTQIPVSGAISPLPEGASPSRIPRPFATRLHHSMPPTQSRIPAPTPTPSTPTTEAPPVSASINAGRIFFEAPTAMAGSWSSDTPLEERRVGVQAKFSLLKGRQVRSPTPGLFNQTAVDSMFVPRV